MTNDYGLFCVFGVLPLLLWAAYITRYWQAQNNFYQYYPLDFLSFSNFINWLFSDTSEHENNVLFQPNTVLEQRLKPTVEEVAQRSNQQNKADANNDKKQQSVNDMAELLGDAFIEYIERNKTLSKTATKTSQHGASDKAEPTTQARKFPDNVVPLFDDASGDHNGELAGENTERTTNNNVDDFNGQINIAGECFELSEEETELLKESYREALNMPSTPRERMYRDFLENFYGVSFDEGVSKLIVQLAELRLDAKKLLLIETSYGGQYQLVNDELCRKPSTTEATE